MDPGWYQLHRNKRKRRAIHFIINDDKLDDHQTYIKTRCGQIIPEGNNDKFTKIEPSDVFKTQMCTNCTRLLELDASRKEFKKKYGEDYDGKKRY